MTLRFRPKAIADLDEIFDYIADESGVGRAESIVRTIHSTAMSLGDNPLSGAARDWILKDLRIFPVRSYATILYLAIPGGIDILRVAYAGVNIDAKFAALGLSSTMGTDSDSDQTA